MKKLSFLLCVVAFAGCTYNNNQDGAKFNATDSDSNSQLVEQQDISTDSLINYLKDIKNIKKDISFNDSLSVTIKYISTTNKCTFAYYYDYTSNWRERTAEKDNKFILSLIVMNSKSKNPQFPQFDIYKIDTTEGKVHLIGSMGYKFSRFDGYAEQIGLYVDEKNSFKYTNSVIFTCFDELSEKELNNSLICVAFFDKLYEQKAFYQKAFYTGGSIAYYDYFNYTDGENYSKRAQNPTTYKDFIKHNTIVHVFNLK